MARARNIKPSLFKNELLGVEDPLLTLLFVNLWCLADREGKLEDRPLRIKAETFPYRENIDINGYLTKLSQYGFIRRYSADGVDVIQIVKFKEHQSPHNTEKASSLPDYNPNYTDIKEQNNLTVSSPLDFRESTEAKRPDSLIPDLLIPDSLNTDSLIPDSLIVPDGVEATHHPVQKIKSIPKNKNTDLSPSHETWEAYSRAYEDRYKVAPVRNATVNAQLSSFIKRIGFEESPHVASFYVNHNNQFYVQKMHTVGLLLSDAEKLRTEWITKQTVTATQARQVDKTQARGNVFNKLIEEVRANATQ